MTNKKNQNLPIIASVALVVVLLVFIIVYSFGASARRLRKQLDLGQKYLAEMNYDQALAAFEAAIEIDPMSVEAYLGAAEAYIGMGDFEGVKAVLERGLTATDDERLSDKLNKLQPPPNQMTPRRCKRMIFSQR